MKELNYMEIGLRIRKSRESQLLTREKLAEMLGTSVKFINDIELGAKGMSLKTLSKLSQILLISTDYILYGDSDDTDLSELIRLMQKCPLDKRKYMEDLIKIFIRSISL
ncbi:MAG: helix-turn-helix transcriptional regulator [Ruminococcus sp.]|nr:helix-turn-helix transcriptional regulator [Ruminococcus sp.]